MQQPLLVAGAVTEVPRTRLLSGPRAIDDAYSTFRFARNLAEGLGFVYNPVQQVLGTAAPRYTLLTTLTWLSRLRDLPAVALMLNAL